MNSTNRTSSLVIASVLLVLAVTLKLGSIAPNVAAFGALSLFCGGFLRGPVAWILPLLGIVAADSIGHFAKINGIYFYNPQTMLINYAGFVAMTAIGALGLRGHERDYARAFGGVLVGSVAFFLISNFGCWLDPLLGYPRTFSGLVDCYIQALPYFQNSQISDIVFFLAACAVQQSLLSTDASFVESVSE